MSLTYGSLCSGIESASVAWEPLGMRPAWFAEIDKFPSAVLAHHWPRVPNLGDMMHVREYLRRGLIERPDVLVAGTPCQAFSIAGLRGGLSDDRGQLTLEFCKIANELPESTIVWENVPGVLNHRDNPFGCLLGALAGEACPLEPPGGKWTYAGYVLGPQRAIAWRTLDAQHFGVAQQRRRVFVVAVPRNGPDPRQILFEFDGVRRDSPPRREAGKDVAGTLAARSGAGGFPGTDEACGGYVQPVARTLTRRGDGSPDIDRGPNVVAPAFKLSGFGGYTEGRGTLRAEGGNQGGGSETLVTYPPAVANTLTARMGKGVNSDINEDQSLVYGLTGDTTPKFMENRTPTLRAEQGGEGRCVVIQERAVCENINAGPQGKGFREGHVAYTLEATGSAQAVYIHPDAIGRDGLARTDSVDANGVSRKRDAGLGIRKDGVAYNLTTGRPGAVLSFSSKDHGQDVKVECSPTLRAEQGGEGRCVVMSFAENSRSELRTGESIGALSAGGGKPGQGYPAVMSNSAVRKLTPVECERLQGFSDGHTDVPYRGKPAADGPRYKALGNSKAVPVVRWIGERILGAHGR